MALGNCWPSCQSADFYTVDKQEEAWLFATASKLPDKLEETVDAGDSSAAFSDSTEANRGKCQAPRMVIFCRKW